MAEIAPSILSADFSRIDEEIAALDRAGVSVVHLDVMDGVFVPNTTFGADLVRQIRPLTGMFFDTHLMVVEPGRHIADFLAAGSDGVTIHFEASSSPQEELLSIRNAGARAGLSIKPATQADDIEFLLPYLDLVLVMSVEPGFGGQAFMPDALHKVRQLACMKEERGYSYTISVDGGVNRSNVETLVECGAELLVIGSAFFSSADYAATLSAFRKLASCSK